jgi:hypothetical protein
MTTIIKRLGLPEDEIGENNGQIGKRSKKALSLLIKLHQMSPPSLEEIKALETIVGELPIEYKNFLQTYNGGVPSPNNVLTKNNERVVNYFFPIKYPHGYDDSIYHALDIYASRIPKTMIPIASAGGGDLVLIPLGDSNNCKIYYWSHDFESDEDGSNYYENIELIADSLNDLLTSFYDFDET